MFVGRKHELSRLEAAWNDPGFQMPIVYGRRRVGKTALLQKFAENKNTIFFTPGKDLAANIKSLRNLMAATGIQSDSDSLPELLSCIFDASRHERLCLIIDEFPYLVSSYPDIVPQLQHIIHKKGEDAKLFLLLCGSSISFMRESVMGYESPLYGRRAREFMIEPFPLHQCQEFLPGTSFSDLCRIYGMTDGTPQYLKFMRDNVPFEENLGNNFLYPDSFLFSEALGLQKQELRDAELYGALLEIVAAGPIRINEILGKMERFDANQAVCANMIKNLLDIGILKSESPVGGNVRKQTLFSIDDLFFRFWHRFIPRVEIAVRNGRQDTALSYIKEHYSKYMGAVFEKIAKQWLLKEDAERNLPISIAQIGRWWGTNHREKRQEEIDIVCQDFDGNTIFCECKWRDQKTDVDVLKDLIRKSQLVVSPDSRHDRRYYIFSKSGFTDKCAQEAAACPNCRLVSLSDMAQTPESREEEDDQGKIMKVLTT